MWNTKIKKRRLVSALVYQPDKSEHSKHRRLRVRFDMESLRAAATNLSIASKCVSAVLPFHLLHVLHVRITLSGIGPRGWHHHRCRLIVSECRQHSVLMVLGVLIDDVRYHIVQIR